MLTADEPIPASQSSFNAERLLYSLAYCSRASAGVDKLEVQRIVATAQRHNANHHITGMLVFGAGLFFQWLEGPRAKVQQLMARLQDDSRHQGIVVLSESEEVRERMFPVWDMEWVVGEDIRVVLEDALSAAHEPQQTQALALLLRELDTGKLAGLEAD
jgi:hypothetical protein